MTDFKETLKQIIKEAKSKNGLLAKPLKEATVNMRRGKNLNQPHDTQVDPSNVPTKVSNVRTANTSDIVPGSSTAPAKEPNLSPGGKFGGRGGDTEVNQQSPFSRETDARTGFNLYHGVVTQVFTELHSLGDGPVRDIVKKVTQWGLMQLKNGDTEGVFQGTQEISPQTVAAIVQKSMQIIVHQIAQEASNQAENNDIFSHADKE